MKIYILSDHSGIVGYFATKKLARLWAEEDYFYETELERDDFDFTFEEYWEDCCRLQEVDLTMENEE